MDQKKNFLRSIIDRAMDIQYFWISNFYLESMFYSSNVIMFDQKTILNCINQSYWALSAFSKVDLSKISKFERHYHSLMSRLIQILKSTACHRKALIILEIYNKFERTLKSGSWWKNELKGLCIKIDAAWRPRVNYV